MSVWDHPCDNRMIFSLCTKRKVGRKLDQMALLACLRADIYLESQIPTKYLIRSEDLFLVGSRWVDRY